LDVVRRVDEVVGEICGVVGGSELGSFLFFV
jgi:hypothetical protein